MTYLTNTVCHFVASGDLVDGSRSRGKEDELAPSLHEGYAGLEESKVSEHLDERSGADAIEGSMQCNISLTVATYVYSPVLFEDSEINFAKRLEPLSQENCGIANDLGACQRKLNRSQVNGAYNIKFGDAMRLDFLDRL